MHWSEVSLMLYWSIPYGILSFPFLVWVRMTFACIIPAMFLSEFELAPNIVITSLFYLNRECRPASGVRHIKYSEHMGSLDSRCVWSVVASCMCHVACVQIGLEVFRSPSVCAVCWLYVRWVWVDSGECERAIIAIICICVLLSAMDACQFRPVMWGP